jgi:hypothetical protein
MAHSVHWSERERERKREREGAKEGGRERKRGREREKIVISIFERNDGCHGTF